jgi:hypothetical protein
MISRDAATDAVIFSKTRDGAASPEEEDDDEDSTDLEDDDIEKGQRLPLLQDAQGRLVLAWSPQALGGAL